MMIENPIILLLEDEEKIREDYGREIAKEFKVRSAGNYEECLGLVRRNNHGIRAVLSDTQGYFRKGERVMGFEIFRDFVDSGLLRPDVCVFGMSTNDGLQHEWLEKGAYLFLRKDHVERKIYHVSGGEIHPTELGAFLRRHYAEFVDRVRASKQQGRLVGDLKLFGQNGNEIDWSGINI